MLWETAQLEAKWPILFEPSQKRAKESLILQKSKPERIGISVTFWYKTLQDYGTTTPAQLRYLASQPHLEGRWHNFRTQTSCNACGNEMHFMCQAWGRALAECAYCLNLEWVLRKISIYQRFELVSLEEHIKFWMSCIGIAVFLICSVMCIPE